MTRLKRNVRYVFGPVPTGVASVHTANRCPLARRSMTMFGCGSAPSMSRSGSSVAEREELTKTGLGSTARCCGRRRHRQANSVRVCAPTSRRVASLRPRSAGLTALTPAPRTLVQIGSCRRCSLIHPLHVVVDVPSRMTLFRATADTSAVAMLVSLCSRAQALPWRGPIASTPAAGIPTPFPDRGARYSASARPVGGCRRAAHCWLPAGRARARATGRNRLVT